MKVLVLSDSHSGLSFMRYAICKVRPDAVIHLGDYYDDGATMEEEYPGIPFHIVPGNCDRYRNYGIHPETLCYGVCGVRFYMTHGHNHHVKSGLYGLLKDARASGAAAALYGHTHEAYCEQEPDGLWILNPGACGSTGGSVGLIEIKEKEILSCRILRRTDLEELV
jgi:putative phosphoesterase